MLKPEALLALIPLLISILCLVGIHLKRRSEVDQLWKSWMRILQTGYHHVREHPERYVDRLTVARNQRERAVIDMFLPNWWLSLPGGILAPAKHKVYYKLKNSAEVDRIIHVTNIMRVSAIFDQMPTSSARELSRFFDMTDLPGRHRRQNDLEEEYFERNSARRAT